MAGAASPGRSWTIALLIVGAPAAAITIAGLAGVGAALAPIEEMNRRLLTSYGLGLVGVLAALLFAVHRLIRRRVTTAASQFADEVKLIAEVNPQHRIDDRHYPALLPIPAAVNMLAEQLAGARAETARDVAAATEKVEDQKRWFEAIMRDLSEGVVVCNLHHQVLLYNQIALTILHVTGEIGLGRSLFNLVTREPVLHALELLSMRVNEAKIPDPTDITRPVVCASVDARTLLQGRMSLILDRDGRPTGYVLTLADVTQEIAALSKRDALLLAAGEGMRRPLANLRAAVETLGAFPAMDAADRRRFDQVVATESAALGAQLEEVSAGYRELVAGYWPMADIYSADLLSCVTQRLKLADGVRATAVGLPVWLRGDSFSLVLALDALVRRVQRFAGAAGIDLECLVGDRRIYIDVSWAGQPVPSAELDGWLAEPLAGAPGGLKLRDVLDRHRSEIWSQPAGTDRAVLRLPVAAAIRPLAQAHRRPLPPRPEFYDFDLLGQGAADGTLGDTRLKALTYVVFDTETTGLEADRGDEVVALGGVRIVNGRLLTGETFERLINPGRPIPADSIRFHGITDDMVRDKPPLAVVLPQFKAFVGDAVLVAHNAAFDMKFLRRREGEAGLAFDNAVLDSLLLSAVLYPDIADHSLDEVARRLGIEIVGRHSALGDALATAAVFVRLVEQLEARGIETLAQAVRASSRAFGQRAGGLG
jgi:DNA polymerase-3 subunit epsilon